MMSETALRYKYDYMRFPLEEESNYELVVRAEDGAPHAYDVYIFKPEMFTYTAAIQHYYVDLARYSDEEILEWLNCWGYTTLEAFQAYLKAETVVHNYELRLVTCITENDFFMKPETLMDADYDSCFDFLVQRLHGRSPLDESDDDHPDKQWKQSRHDIGGASEW